MKVVKGMVKFVARAVAFVLVLPAACLAFFGRFHGGFVFCALVLFSVAVFTAIEDNHDEAVRFKLRSRGGGKDRVHHVMSSVSTVRWGARNWGVGYLEGTR